MMRRTQPLISIGLPVFNGEKHIHEAIDSLLTQTSAEFELIISDNASTDSTPDICQEYARLDSRIRYVRQPKNIGARANFIFVLHEAHSKYFMWAATDDYWSPDFLGSLWTALENDPTAIGAFCPYQLMEEDTGASIEGVWKCNYEDERTFVRLIKLTRQYGDACIYGLFRRQVLDNIQFEPWGWINVNTPYNLVFPVLYLLLSKGNLLFVGNKPLWHKRISLSHWHSTPFKGNPIFAYFAHIVRKMQLLVRSLHYIWRGSRSLLLVILMTPFLFLRLFYDSLTPVYAAAVLWLSGRKISQVAPHEVWRLGVR